MAAATAEEIIKTIAILQHIADNYPNASIQVKGAYDAAPKFVDYGKVFLENYQKTYNNRVKNSKSSKKNIVKNYLVRLFCMIQALKMKEKNGLKILNKVK